MRNYSRPAKKASTLDPSLLVKEADAAVVEKVFRSDRLIKDMPLSVKLKEALARKGYERPTEIQDRTLETLLQGRDLLGIAQTGTGKTGAFLVPIIEQLLHKRVNPYALVVVPTRELALQVEEEFKSMSQGLGLYSACFIGGTNINRDLQTLRRNSHVVIATPGRLLDLADRKAIHLNKFNTLVLDEFDRMLDMGFIRDVKRILEAMKDRTHTMLFSATLDKSQQAMIDRILKDHVSVKVSSGKSTGEGINQEVIRLEPGQDKFKVLHHMLSQEEFKKVLLFEETKHRVSRLCMKLNKAGIRSEQIHGNKSQNARQNALKAFKIGRVQVLVATDVASRGLDVSDVSHVINYQVPQTHDSYIHRIGRTGRAGKVGKAFTFVSS
jgi:ATP-dependent RNA helicase RhlE